VVHTSILKTSERDKAPSARRGFNSQFGFFVELTHESLLRSKDPEPLHFVNQCRALKPKKNG
jgi:hypothetical protein